MSENECKDCQHLKKFVHPLEFFVYYPRMGRRNHYVCKLDKRNRLMSKKEVKLGKACHIPVEAA